MSDMAVVRPGDMLVIALSNTDGSTEAERDETKELLYASGMIPRSVKISFLVGVTGIFTIRAEN